VIVVAKLGTLNLWAESNVKLIEALEILRSREALEAEPLPVFLACGFQPLHLQTFIAGEIAMRVPDRLPRVEVGLFGNLTDSLERVVASRLEAAAISIEWADLDPRLDIRSLGGWGPSKLGDIIAQADSTANRLARQIERCASMMPVSVNLPTLTPPPVFVTAGWQQGPEEARLDAVSRSLSERLASSDGVRLVSQQRLLMESSPAERADFASAVETGFPYTRQHADVLARLHSLNLFPPKPLKGLITDLDDTLWKGILGEEGPDGVHWDLEHHAQMHGAYQLMLQSLMEAGVMVAVASHNDSGLVRQIFSSGRLALQPDRIYPQVVNWEPKSNAVTQILRTWNVDATDVLFVDDSAHVLAEVKQAHPNINIRTFPTSDTHAAVQLLLDLRDLFGKARITEEGLVFLAALGRQLAVKTPIMDSVIMLTSRLMSRDYRAEAPHTPDTLGIAGLDARALEELVS